MNSRLFSICLMFALLMLSASVLLNFNLKAGYDVAISYEYPEIKPEKIVSQPDTESTSVVDDDLAEEVESEAQPEQEHSEVVYFPLELNNASMEELMKIPKIGRVTATRIIQYRDHIGGYQDLEQLTNIKGIGEKTFNEISAYLYLDGDEWDKS